MSKFKPCPKCGSAAIAIEKRIDGDSTCQDCGHKMKTADWPKDPPPPKTVKELQSILLHLDNEIQRVRIGLNTDKTLHGDEQRSMEDVVKQRIGKLGFELHKIQEMVKNYG